MISRLIKNSPQYKEFVKVSIELKKYLKVDCCEPPELSKRFKEALQSYRDLLDSYNMRMPKEIFPYKRDDKSTWKYLDCKVNSDNYVGAVHNDDWIYRQTIINGVN